MSNDQKIRNIEKFFKEVKDKGKASVVINVKNPSLKHIDIINNIAEKNGYVITESDISSDRNNMTMVFYRMDIVFGGINENNSGFIH